MNILVLDDEAEIADLVELFLKNEGYNIFKFYDSKSALQCVFGEHIDLALLDVMLPDTDGFTVLRKIREDGYKFPVIMLTAKVEDNDKIIGLSLGADDYITKPFNPLELVARVKSQIRRYINLGSMVQTPSQLVTGGLVLDTDAKTLSVDGENVKVTPIEYKIMEYLMTNMGRVLSSSQIYEAVWNEPSFTSEKTVTVHIRNIREKIEINPKDPKYIKVVYGLGYKCEKI